ncbi:hypothetical protein A3A68_00710 [Candidatus Saccharibacteria bacterium RIFCSPLOWO2_01_FULL_48_13]|nr:MAG: hypothetical protein A2884_00055 [Candidatus Saccharibacteria bacterium RIFCSPHIGHO2_01_FULL_48_12]OGL35243.1 MAG: hypothetical protein A3F38_01035 [Candidatus Saccharibacteria bacterium RIFCSPHIGHO2_12_FULL_48_21]OGL37395.1 MAG: hypothetical protein A3A68_00710 [Candidatus Saccharibacteria bacterium RIFCSPLOWO2_01_FULL_48_13]
MKKGEKSQFALIEEDILKKWDTEQIFESSLKLRYDCPLFSFFDGPPFASGEPHYGHLEQTTVKDSVARYKTMRGYYVPRRTGWDTHGLPIEYRVEKELKLNSKKDIEAYGVEKFNVACREIVFRHKNDFDAMYRRMGRWDNPKNTYATLDSSYIESVWWILSEINKKGLLYRGFKSLPYCPRCETPLSNFELNEGYRDNVPDPSVYATFPLVKDPAVSLLAWTTTPWTLPANAALAVDPDATYAYAKLKSDSSTLILAKSRLEELSLRKTDYNVSREVKGHELVGLRYQPLYPLDNAKYSLGQAKNAHRVLADEAVDIEDGTGILHVAPRYGETDLALGLAEDLPLIESVDSSGHMVAGIEGVGGKFFKDADEHITAHLTKQGRIFAAEVAGHTYPFCWRCDTPLMYFATSTWFVSVSSIRDDMLKTASGINWVPPHVKKGRFGKWLEGARDWAISRNRYWGAPMPVWQNVDDEEDYIVVGSIDELKKLAGSDIRVDDLHRPFIDEIVIEHDGKTYKRIEEVLDCWFESGSMPVAQRHYPFDNKEAFENSFPADFVVEAVEQVHLWFYTLHVLATTLFNGPAYKNVIADGLILAADGRKLSKRLRNYPPINELLDKFGADTTRLFVLSSPLMNGEDTRMTEDLFRDIYRNVLMTLFNSHSFFLTYSELDGWQPQRGKRTEPDNILDRWILARLDQTVSSVTKHADTYQLAKAVRPISGFVDDLSNWYIRRSRKRFWKSENDKDKVSAYSTLHYGLSVISQLMAPWAPFISDHLWRQLNAGADLPISVHLTNWPSINKPDSASTKLLEDMKKVKEVIVQGLAQRAEVKIKVRQPLEYAVVNLKVDNTDEFGSIIAEELNVKEVKWSKTGAAITVNTKLTPELKAEGLARDLVRSIQNARKNAGFNVQDRILLAVESKSTDITEAVSRFKEIIYDETLAVEELLSKDKPDHKEAVDIGTSTITISLKRKD